jgi:hypothetical protein
MQPQPQIPAGTHLLCKKPDKDDSRHAPKAMHGSGLKRIINLELVEYDPRGHLKNNGGTAAVQNSCPRLKDMSTSCASVESIHVLERWAWSVLEW